MAALVGYGSSDEEDDVEIERPAKIPKLDGRGVQEANQVTRAEPWIAGPSETQAPPSASPHAPVVESEPTEYAPGPAPGPSIPRDAGLHVAAATSDPTWSPYTFERQRLRELTMPTVPNFSIPDSPPPDHSNSEEAAQLAATSKKFERFLALKEQGVHFNQRLQTSSSLRNPSLLPKLMDFAGVSQEDSWASSLPEDLAVPVRWQEDCYVENLTKRNERREKKRVAERDKVEFAAAGKGDGRRASGGVPGGGGAGQRKSRFDQR